MTRLFTDGAETHDILFWTTGSPTNVATSPRSGNRCYSLVNNTSITKTLPGNFSEVFLRIGWKGNAGSGSAFYWRKDQNELGSVRVNTGTSRMEIWIGNALAATGTLVITTGVWYLVEIHLKIANTDGLVELKMDGALDVAYSGDTQPTADTYVNGFRCYAAGTNYYDDLACNDTAGAADNSWCGDGRIVLLTPNGNGAASQFAGSDGNSTDNYLLVDDLPANGDTDYVYDSVSGHVDQYNLTTFTIPANHVITRVIPVAYAREETASGDAIQLGIRSGSAEEWSSDIVQSTTYKWYEGKSHTVDPATGAAWTQAGLDGLQVGVKIP